MGQINKNIHIKIFWFFGWQIKKND